MIKYFKITVALDRPNQILSMIFWNFSKKFSTKIQLTNPGKYFRKPFHCCHKWLAIGDQASVNEYTRSHGFFSMKQNVKQTMKVLL